MKSEYKISELVKELKINKETIRYYERIGLLSNPSKNESGYRIYTKEDIEKLSFIIMVKGLGFSLKEISMLIHDEILCGDIKEIKGIVNNKMQELNIKINELEEKKKLLQKVNDTILVNNINNCDDVKQYLENNS